MLRFGVVTGSLRGMEFILANWGSSAKGQPENTACDPT